MTENGRSGDGSEVQYVTILSWCKEDYLVGQRSKYRI